MKLQDDRTPEQKETYPFLIVGTDSFMSGWGEAAGGTSYAAWACKDEHRDRVLNWVSSRNDMKQVKLIDTKVYGTYKPKGIGHCHIYVVHDKHPALR